MSTKNTLDNLVENQPDILQETLKEEHQNTFGDRQSAWLRHHEQKKWFGFRPFETGCDRVRSFSRTRSSSKNSKASNF